MQGVSRGWRFEVRREWGLIREMAIAGRFPSFIGFGFFFAWKKSSIYLGGWIGCSFYFEVKCIFFFNLTILFLLLKSYLAADRCRISM